MSRSNKKPTGNRDIILDSNVVQYFFSIPEYKDQISALLIPEIQKGYGVAISDYTYFELINGSSIEKEEKLFSAIEGGKRYYVMRGVLIAAGRLGCWFDDHKIQGVDNGDKIIGATALLNQAIVLTANGRHFPQPFFKELARATLERTDKNGSTHSIYLYYMEPDYSLVDTHATERLQKIEQLRIEQSKNVEK